MNQPTASTPHLSDVLPHPAEGPSSGIRRMPTPREARGHRCPTPNVIGCCYKVPACMLHCDSRQHLYWRYNHDCPRLQLLMLVPLLVPLRVPLLLRPLLLLPCQLLPLPCSRCCSCHCYFSTYTHTNLLLLLRLQLQFCNQVFPVRTWKQPCLAGRLLPGPRGPLQPQVDRAAHLLQKGAQGRPRLQLHAAAAAVPSSQVQGVPCGEA